MSNIMIGFQSSIIGMGIVMLVLYIISGAISLLKHLGKKSPIPEPIASIPNVFHSDETEAQTKPSVLDDGEIVSAIVAAISAYTGIPANKLIIRSLKKDDSWKKNTLNKIRR